MMFAVSVALVMLEWMRTSYLSPNAANRFPVSSACSRPGSKKQNKHFKYLFCQKRETAHNKPYSKHLWTLNRGQTRT